MIPETKWRLGIIRRRRCSRELEVEKFPHNIIRHALQRDFISFVLRSSSSIDKIHFEKFTSTFFSLFFPTKFYSSSGNRPQCSLPSPFPSPHYLHSLEITLFRRHLHSPQKVRNAAIFTARASHSPPRFPLTERIFSLPSSSRVSFSHFFAIEPGTRRGRGGRRRGWNFINGGEI